MCEKCEFESESPCDKGQKPSSIQDFFLKGKILCLPLTICFGMLSKLEFRYSWIAIQVPLLCPDTHANTLAPCFLNSSVRVAQCPLFTHCVNCKYSNNQATCQTISQSFSQQGPSLSWSAPLGDVLFIITLWDLKGNSCRPQEKQNMGTLPFFTWNISIHIGCLLPLQLPSKSTHMVVRVGNIYSNTWG